MRVEKEVVLGVAYYNKGFEIDREEHDRKHEDRKESCNGTVMPSEVKRNGRPSVEMKNGTIKERDNDEENEGKTDDKLKNTIDDDIPDGGWGWVVAIGGFLGQTMANILVSSYGILYAEKLLEFETSAVLSAWMYSLMGFMFTFSGMFLRGLVGEFGFRKTAFAGTFLIAFGTGATAFANSPWIILIFYSLLAGLGNGIIATLTYTVVPYYFKKRLGLANAIMCAGVSAGQFVGPPLITLLQGQYGFMGATLVLSAVLLNSGLGAAVFHPREWHGKRPRFAPRKSNDGSQGFALVKRILKNTMGNFLLLRSPKSVIIAVGGMLNATGYLNFLMLLPFAMQEYGFAVEDAANCVAVSGFTNLATRLVVSTMADYSWFDLRICFLIGTAVVFGLSIVFCYLRDLTIITVVMGFWGCGVGMYMGIFSLVMIRYAGMENLMAQLGLTNFLGSFWFLSAGPIYGLIRDVSGSYSYSLFALAGSICITFLLYFLLPAAIAYEQRRDERKREKPRSLP